MAWKRCKAKIANKKQYVWYHDGVDIDESGNINQILINIKGSGKISDETVLYLTLNSKEHMIRAYECYRPRDEYYQIKAKNPNKQASGRD